MNPGGVRADFTGDEIVTYEEAFTVQPFNNLVATQTYTGAQLLDVLKDQWCGTNSAADGAAAVEHHPLHVRPVRRRLDPRQAVRGRGEPGDRRHDRRRGADPAASYRITTNNFLADGGDDFQSLKAGTDRTTLSDFDIDSLVRYLAPTLQPGAPPIGPPALDRIDVTP